MCIIVAKKDVQRKILDACINLSYGQMDGSLFIAERGAASGYYKYGVTLYHKGHRKLSVLNSYDLLTIKKLASIDGAVIVARDGSLKAYAATLTYSKRIIGHGKRHAFAAGTTARNPMLIAILASEEDRHIRIFENGITIFDIDSRTRIPVRTKDRVIELLLNKTSLTIIAGAIATSVLVLNPLPAIVTIAGSQVLVAEGFERLKKFFNGS